MLSNLPPFLANSTLPQWISAFASSGLFIGVLTFVLKWRGQSIGSDADFAGRQRARQRAQAQRHCTTCCSQRAARKAYYTESEEGR
jgi:hypothetical protein